MLRSHSQLLTEHQHAGIDSLLHAYWGVGGDDTLKLNALVCYSQRLW